MTLFEIHREEIDFGGKKLVLETGKIARQAAGSVVATLGGTIVHAAVCLGKEVPSQDDEMLPLTVNYQEKFYAAGRIPGGFFKREAKPSEGETLICRLIDRPIRPLFAEGFKKEIQITTTLLSHDLEHESDALAIIASSAALCLSGAPFMGPVAAMKIGYKDGQYLLNPTVTEQVDSQLSLVVAGTSEGVLMVESEAHELSEEVMLGAVTAGHEAYQKVIDGIIRLAERAAKDPLPLPERSPEYLDFKKKIFAQFSAPLSEAYKIVKKSERQTVVDGIKEEIKALAGEDEVMLNAVPSVFKKLEKDIVRGAVLKTGMRIDGRDTKTVRPIETEVGLLPCVHGSALFTRGETQGLVITTLGTGDDEQMIDAVVGESTQKFMLHYNFPGFATGEPKRAMGPGRREIGHGKLAWRAINPLLPTQEKFPYTIRVVSEITESNGSSSMATVCGTSMALMDAGVPLERPIAGVAMGLIKEGKDVAVLTDILGDEDFLGDMDFKVAGTENGITALQMDIKITSITKDIMKTALAQAKDGRMHILGEMGKAISESRPTVNANAPRITTIKIPKDKIREVIGSGGKVIKEITEKTGAKIDINDDGVVNIASNNSDKAKAALEWIQGIVAEAELNKIYSGKVVKIMEFGAFVNFLGSQDGLVHISELAPQRVAKVEDVVKEGDMVKVKCIGFDRGKVKLSMKRVNQESGEDLDPNGEMNVERPERSEKSDRPRRDRKDKR